MSHTSAGSAMAMIWQSGSWRSARTLRSPWPPTPMTATLTLSLGATNRGPPRTCRGTIVAAAAVAVVAMKWRRLVVSSLWLMSFPSSGPWPAPGTQAIPTRRGASLALILPPQRL